LIAPALALQQAVNARLKAPEFQALCEVAVGVHDRVPKDPSFPYVNIGYIQPIGDLAQGYDGSELNLTLHVWSRAVGKVEGQRIAHAVRLVLTPPPGDPPPFDLEDHELVNWRFEGSLPLDDPDGVTTHVVFTAQFLTRPTA